MFTMHIARRHAPARVAVTTTDCHSGHVGEWQWAARLRPSQTSTHETTDVAAIVERAIPRLAASRSEFVKSLTGPFALALWNATTGEVVAARDAIGLAPLYYSQSTTGLTLSDSPDGIADRGAYDPAYVADFIASAAAVPDRTVWTNVHRVAPGTFLRWTNGPSGQATVHQFWAADGIPQHPTLTLVDAAREFRRLAREGVAEHVTPGQTWAHLSGGLDSSTVVALAANLDGHATRSTLAGTVTLVDSLGNADETRYSDAIVHQLGVANQKVHDYWPWRDDGEEPFHTDQPERDFPWYARHRHVGRLVTAAGGATVLSGVGPDHYFPLTPAVIADLVRVGRPADAGRALMRWTMATGDSLWRTFPRELIAPLLPPLFTGRRRPAIPDWIRPSFAKRFDVGRRLAGFGADELSRKRSRQESIARQFSRLAAMLPAWSDQRVVPVVHPLLHKPLVDFCLALPPELGTDFQTPKPVLRAAMRDLMPPVVVRRATKSHFGPRVRWAMGFERARLGRLLARPLLADLGCIEPKRMLQAVDACAAGSPVATQFLYAALSLETWLATRAGEYPAVRLAT